MIASACAPNIEVSIWEAWGPRWLGSPAGLGQAQTAANGMGGFPAIRNDGARPQLDGARGFSSHLQLGQIQQHIRLGAPLDHTHLVANPDRDARLVDVIEVLRKEDARL
jgi:hypothetical protein